MAKSFNAAAIVLSSAFTLPLFAQTRIKGGYGGQYAEQIAGNGNSDLAKKIRDEQSILDSKKSNPLTWDNFPLITFPKHNSLAKTRSAIAREESLFEQRRKSFVKAKLQGRYFSGLAKVVSVDPAGPKFKVLAEQVGDAQTEQMLKRAHELDVARSEMNYLRDGVGSPGIAPELHWRQSCIWIANDKSSVSVGQQVVIKGPILDCTQEGQFATVEIDKPKLSKP